MLPQAWVSNPGFSGADFVPVVRAVDGHTFGVGSPCHAIFRLA